MVVAYSYTHFFSWVGYGESLENKVIFRVCKGSRWHREIFTLEYPEPAESHPLSLQLQSVGKALQNYY